VQNEPHKAPLRGIFNVHPGKLRDLPGKSGRKSRTPGSEQPGQVLGALRAHFWSWF